MRTAVCIVTFPLSEAGYTPLSNLVGVISKLASHVYVVSGGPALEKLENSKREASIDSIRIVHKVSPMLLPRIINYVHTQLKILCSVIATSRYTDLFIFSIGGEDLLIPILTLKLLKKQVVLMPGGVATKGYLAKRDPLSKSLSLLIDFTCGLADRIILYSDLLSQEPNFVKHSQKIMLAHEHFIDFSKFTLKVKMEERPNKVGYIGRMSEEKGILNLLDAIPMISKKRPDVTFILCGNGNLVNVTKAIVAAKGLEKVVKIENWVSHEDVPKYLNELRLLVLPSQTEGLPNILLEAMGCGTPVLAAPVGAIPDIVQNGETGFLLSINNSQCISDSIIYAIDNLEILKKISVNSNEWVKNNFSESRTITLWKELLETLKMLRQ
jgi:glycosyltransferase involved in cell wall biosynthesis